MTDINLFEYQDLVNGEIVFVVDELGGTLEYSQAVVISYNNQTINSVRTNTCTCNTYINNLM